MTAVRVDAFVPHRDVDEVFDLIVDFARYAEVCPEVRTVSVARIDEGLLRSTWEVAFRDGALIWTEEDRVDRTGRTIVFEQIDGDFEEFFGTWTVRSHDRGSPDRGSPDRGSEVSFEATFDLGLASLRSIVEPIAERSLRENVELILLAVLGAGTTIVETPVDRGT